jgi:methyl-accepting chemotaxis protein
MATTLAVIIAVSVVQTWTLHVVANAEERSAQTRLDINLAVLKQEFGHLGSDWRLGDDGRLLLDGKPAGGLDKLVKDVGRITGGVVTVFVGDTRMATTVRRPDGSPATGTKLAPGAARDAVIGLGKTYRGIADILGARYFTVYQPFLDPAGKPIGILFVGVPQASVESVLHSILVQSILTGLIVQCVVIALGWLLLRVNLQPLQALASAVNAISDGDLGIVVPCADRTDQLGQIGRVVQKLRDGAQHANAMEVAAAADRAEKVRRQEAMDQVTQDFGASVAGVLSTLIGSASTMRDASGDMAGAAEQTRSNMASTASQAATTSRNLSRVAAATEQLTSSVGEITRQVTQAATAAQEAVDQARTAEKTVHGLSEAASQIGAVLDLIGRIAAQTNLLALNATIEAARAGEAGKGFAVVAGEVKQLATQTRQATGQISAQVTAIQTATGGAATAVRKVVDAIGRVSEVAIAIAGAVDQQGSATHEIAAQVQAVSQATDSATQAMNAASQTAERSGDNSKTVLAAANEVTSMTENLHAEVNHFVTAMRASQKNSNRRKYERVPGANAVARIRHPVHGTASAPINDVALGGAALACSWPCAIGTQIMVALPGVKDEVSARVVSARGNVIGIAFRQDPAALAAVSQAMDHISGVAHAA